MDKKCTCCGVKKDSSEFQKRAASIDGLTASCKSCLSVRDAAKHQKFRDNRLATARAYNATEAAKAAHALSVAKWRKSNPLRLAAHNAINKAVMGGWVVAQPCFVCGVEKTEAHHPDYSQRLDVVWLCVEHHKQAHALAYSLRRKAA